MFTQAINLLALDFDGVICDGLIEYFASTKKAYQQIWQTEEIDDRLVSSFYRLRPVIETGWEMPILLRALVLGVSETEILTDWQAIALKILTSEKLDKLTVGQKLDGVRDNWIQQDLDSWLKLHRFYPGMIESLQQIVNSQIELYIVSTKEGRFIQQLLQQQGINLSPTQIIGKECKRPKYETLRILRDQHQATAAKINIYFVEDRLPALQQVMQQPDLEFVNLYLADWGYNLESDRRLAEADQRLQLLSLKQFEQEFLEQLTYPSNDL
jgi:phosphoglycolate phosphatase-like HAD superfamily hydrolase